MRLEDRERWLNVHMPRTRFFSCKMKAFCIVLMIIETGLRRHDMVVKATHDHFERTCGITGDKHIDVQAPVRRLSNG